ncbi:MAG: hypothetical protein AAF591_09925, partial [Verrucomicrobiota bacterium]
PHSSLSHMMGVLTRFLGAPDEAFLIGTSGTINYDALARFANQNEPRILFGTALAFLNLIEQNESIPALPPGSWLFETGGYKGTGRTLEKTEFYQQLEQNFAVPADHIINEYAMTELSSQFYTSGLHHPHRAPHWLRARVINPATNTEVADGESGVLHITDLANLGSCLAVATRDLAVRRGTDFELTGRDPDALPRGCSRTADELLNS